MTSSTRKNYLRAYIEQNNALISGLIVKFKYAALATNREVRKLHGEAAVNDYQPSTWKYYVNVSGSYHFTDTPMKVISLDTREEILFSKENLLQHTATAEGYKRGSRYFKRLCLEYPDQEFLIGCILTPSNLTHAIEAPEGSILAYPRHLVETYESTLIFDLEQQIKTIQKRWNVEAFSLSDPYYASVQVAMLSLVLRPILLNLRERRRKSDEVHSFHLREYLASRQKLDRFLPYLTREQSLWIYRNVRYLERNAGKIETFNTLLENLLNKRMIPLAEYTIRQSPFFDLSGYPITKAYRNTISKANMAGDIEYADLWDLYNKEKKTAPGNERHYKIIEQDTTHKLKTTNTSVLKTKDLESAMIDISNMVPDPLPIVLLRQWISMTHMGLYNAVIHFQDPLTAEPRSLLSRDAIIYVYYLVNKMYNIPFTELPAIEVVKFRNHPRPKAEELIRLIEPNMPGYEEMANELVSAQPIFTQIHSVTSFQKVARQVYDECLKHYYMQAGEYDVYHRGVMEQMILKLFGSALMDFSNGENVEEWRLRNNLPEYRYSYRQAENLIIEIYTQATGYMIDDTRSIRSIQKALIEMFAQLSSYSIQFIREVNDGDVLLAGPPHTRYGNVKETGLFLLKHIHYTRFQPPTLKGKNSVFVDIAVGFDVTIKNAAIEINEEVNVNLDIDVHTQTGLVGKMIHRASYMEPTIHTRDPLTGNWTVFPAGEPESFLTSEQFQNLKFINT